MNPHCEALHKLPVKPEHASVIVGARVEIARLERALANMTADRDSYKRSWEMYAGAWLRELGGKVFHKQHHIDALVITTRHIYRWYEHGVRCLGFPTTRDVEPPTAEDRVQRCVQIADRAVPEYRGTPRRFSCGSHTAKRWQAAWDGACVALGGDPAVEGRP